ncbi:hypothetical protein TWF718_009105 [Orbilia javanica]|uniref:Uncharacterized protein n=1 Tax=Orbilia javanica TaxID=47235 RepID=A0AAN8RCC2_9PEZI
MPESSRSRSSQYSHTSGQLPPNEAQTKGPGGHKPGPPRDRRGSKTTTRQNKKPRHHKLISGSFFSRSQKKPERGGHGCNSVPQAHPTASDLESNTGASQVQNVDQDEFAAGSSWQTDTEVDDTDRQSILSGFEDIFDRAHDWCTQYSSDQRLSEDKEWWNNTPDKASELSAVLATNSKNPLQFNDLNSYTISELGTAYLCGKITCSLFPLSEPDQYLAIDGASDVDPKDFWTDTQTAKSLLNLEEVVYNLSTNRPHALHKADKWRSKTVTLLSHAADNKGKALNDRGRKFSGDLLESYVKFIGINPTSEDVGEGLKKLVLLATKISRQLRQQPAKYLVGYPTGFSCRHKFRSTKPSSDPDFTPVNYSPLRLNIPLEEQIDECHRPVRYKPDDNRTWVVNRPLLLILRQGARHGEDQPEPSICIKASLLYPPA